MPSAKRKPKTAHKKAKRKVKAKRAPKRAAPREGCAALLVIDEWGDGAHEQVSRTASSGSRPGKPAVPKRSGAAAVGRRSYRPTSSTCRAFAAAGHATRAKLLAKLLNGPATYRALQTATKLAAGPLYHHINQLRLAGLILPKQRDLYELTRGGRNLVMTMAALEPLLRDGRRRPVGV